MVSVIIPIYNGAGYVEDCLHSVMNQSYRDIEIIIIDDGSTDESYSICEKIMVEDRRMRLIRQENAGVSAARNRGLMLAKGDFVTFVDVDDLLLPDALNALIGAMDQETDMVVGSYEEYRAGHIKPIVNDAKEYVIDSSKSAFTQIDQVMGPPWGKLFRLDIIQKNNIRFDTSIPYGEDNIFNVEYCKYVRKVNIINAVVYRYLLGGIASSVKYYPNRNLFNLMLLTTYVEFFGDHRYSFPSFEKRKIYDQLHDCFMHYVVHCSRQEAQLKIEQTFKLFSSFINRKTIDTEYYSLALANSINLFDAEGVYVAVFKENWKRIVLRKIKKVYYKFFNRRI